VRIRGESRTSTAVLDPTSSVYTEINEWGPEVADDELDTLREKLAYLTQGAEFVVFAGSLPRGVEPESFGEIVREASRRHQLTVVDSDGEPLRAGTAAEPYLIAPNVREAEELVGHEFVDEEDFITALDEIAELGARNVMITQETGCYALLRQDRNEVRLRARAPALDAVSRIGAGDTLLAGYLAARVGGKSFEDAVRMAVATGAASVLETGPGRFDLREASRLTTLVTIEHLERVAS
jgi:1-phosphofructokinase family hexose kinase